MQRRFAVDEWAGPTSRSPGHGADVAARDEPPDLIVAYIGEIKRSRGAKSHASGTIKLGLHGWASVARRTMLAVTGNHDKAAIAEALKNLVAGVVGNEQVAVRADCHRAWGFGDNVDIEVGRT